MERTQPGREKQRKTDTVRRALTHVEFLKLAEWIRRNEAKLKKDRPVLQDAAKMFTEETGIPCSQHSISGAREAVGVDWFPVRGANGSSNKFSRFNQMYNTQQVCIEAIVNLYAKLNEPIPDDLRELLSK